MINISIYEWIGNLYSLFARPITSIQYTDRSIHCSCLKTWLCCKLCQLSCNDYEYNLSLRQTEICFQSNKFAFNLTKIRSQTHLSVFGVLCCNSSQKKSDMTPLTCKLDFILTSIRKNISNIHNVRKLDECQCDDKKISYIGSKKLPQKNFFLSWKFRTQRLQSDT